MKEEFIKQICASLNELLPCDTQEKLDAVVAILHEMFAEIPGSQLYYMDDVLSVTGGNPDLITYHLMHDERMVFVPSKVPEKFPGVFLSVRDTKV